MSGGSSGSTPQRVIEGEQRMLDELGGALALPD
jgi:hypothetical protein